MLDVSASPSAATAARPWYLRRACVLTFMLALAGVEEGRCVWHGWWHAQSREEALEKKAAHTLKGGSDFTAYYSAAELARDGKDIYAFENSSTPFRACYYPPTFAALVWPLAYLPHNAALIFFHTLNMALLLATLWLLKRVLYPAPAPPGPFWRQPEAGLGLAVLICLKFLNANYFVGNFNGVILFLAAFCLWGLYTEQGRRTGRLSCAQRGFWSGAAVALATCTKLYPGLLGAYFLWSRRAWAMVGGALGLVFFGVIFPMLVLGRAETTRALDEVGARYSGLLSGKHKPAELAGAGGPKAAGEPVVGFSLRGMLTRWLSPVAALEDADGDNDSRINVLSLTSAQAALVANIVSALVLLLTIIFTAGRWARSPAGLPLSLGAVCAATVLISPLTRAAHCVVLLIPVAALLALWQQDRLPPRARGLALGAVGLLGLSTLLASREVVGKDYALLLQAGGAVTVPNLVLLAAVFYAIHGLAKEEGTKGTEGTERTEGTEGTERTKRTEGT